ncbi:uncharacterized protein LOC143518469 [Brachyhypopomus gauderio]|uniref:uncharacterized protein LOC143518469 n=1 Tax=Brachyhypopomus gauderio TaxID=698409 RepID=UPI0040416C58
MSGNEGRTSVRKVNFRLPHIPQPFPPTITDISAKPQGPINEVSRSVASKPFLSRIPNQDPGNSSQICSQGYNTEHSNPEMFSAANPQGQNQDKRFADLSWSVPSRPFDPFVLNHKPGITSFPHSPYDGNNSQICNNEHEGTQVIPGANSQDLFDGRNASASSLLTCPRGMGTEEKCVFRPQFRVGQHSGPISCSAAELHILLLLENIKQQVSQLSATVGFLMTRVGSTPQLQCEMPEEFQFPLDSIDEVDQFEVWIVSRKCRKKKQSCKYVC